MIQKTTKRNRVLFIIVGLVMIGLFVTLVFSSFNGKTLSDSELGFLSMSYQVIFLTTSLLSLLSDKSETIYWERFTEYVMVTPKIINFIGLSVIGYLSLVVQTICYFHPSWREAFYISFSIGIVIIIILWWKMSSIFFRRDYYKKRLEKKTPEKSNILVLRELTYAAIENHNYRALGENLDYLIEKSISANIEDNQIGNEAIYSILLIFEYLDSHNQREWITNQIEKDTKLLKMNPSLSYVFAQWIMRDPSRKEIWDSLRKYVMESRESLSCFLEVYIQTSLEQYPIELCKGKEEEQKILIMQCEEDERIKRIIDIRKKYEDFIYYYVSFVFKNDLAEEQKAIIEKLAIHPDLIQACPEESILAVNNGKNSFEYFIDIIVDDDRMFSSFISAYGTVLFSVAYEDVIWETERDESIVNYIMESYNKKTNHDNRLISVFERFMLEFVPSTSSPRKKYVESLLEKRDYDRLKEIICYDKGVFDFISEQVEDDCDSYARIPIFIRGLEGSFVTSLDNVGDNSENGTPMNESDKTDMDNTAENDDIEPRAEPDAVGSPFLVKSNLIKIEYRPDGGKDRKEMIEFWNNIKNEIDQDHNHVCDILNEYLEMLNKEKQKI